MENIADQRASDTVPTVSEPQPSNPQSLFKKPDIYCRFSACLNTLGAISILIGCLLIKRYTIVGITFLIIGFFMTVSGVILVLMAVSLIMKKERNRKYRNINRKFLDEYRSVHTPGDLKLELVSKYFTPVDKPRSHSLTHSIDITIDPLETSVDTFVKNKRMKNSFSDNNRQLIGPELRVEHPPEDVGLSPSPTPTKRRLALSPSKCSTKSLNEEICVPFYPPRSPTMKCPNRLRCSPESMSRSVSKCSLYSQTSEHRSRSVSPQRHKLYI